MFIFSEMLEIFLLSHENGWSLINFPVYVTEMSCNMVCNHVISIQ